MTIITLWKHGKSKREIARITGHDRKTVQRIIRGYQEGGIERPVQALKRASAILPYQEHIIAYMERGLSGVRIQEELKGLGYFVKYRTLCYFMSQLKEQEEICVRFHTLAGEEAQVDFGYVGILPDAQGIKRKAWVFNMRLSYWIIMRLFLTRKCRLS